jgi:hypothetical protein
MKRKVEDNKKNKTKKKKKKKKKKRMMREEEEKFKINVLLMFKYFYLPERHNSIRFYLFLIIWLRKVTEHSSK